MSVNKLYNVAECFSERLKLLKSERNLSNSQLSMDSGLSKTTVDNWDKGTIIPNAYSLAVLCVFFDVSADWLLGLSDVREIKKNE